MRFIPPELCSLCGASTTTLLDHNMVIVRTCNSCDAQIDYRYGSPVAESWSIVLHSNASLTIEVGQLRSAAAQTAFEDALLLMKRSADALRRHLAGMVVGFSFATQRGKTVVEFAEPEGPLYRAILRVVRARRGWSCATCNRPIRSGSFHYRIEQPLQWDNAYRDLRFCRICVAGNLQPPKQPLQTGLRLVGGADAVQCGDA